MPTAADLDAIDGAALRAAGGLKWVGRPERWGAWVAEMDFGAAPVILEALRRGVETESFGYLSPALDAELSSATADFVSDQYGWSVDPGSIRPLADVLAGLQAAIEHFSRPRSPVILPVPAYMPFLTVPLAMHREIRPVPMPVRDGRSEIDLDALDAAFRAGGHLLVLTNPHNPTGRVFSRDELLGIAEVVDRHGGRVFADEIHAPLAYAGHRHLPYASLSPMTASHTVTSIAASKAWNLPGLKCAQLILSNAADRELWSQVGQVVEHGASNLGIHATVAAYREGGPWLADVLDYLRGNRDLLGDLLSAALPSIRYQPPEGTYLAWLDCADLGLGDAPAAFFAEHADVALTDGPACGKQGRGHVRLNFATPRPVLEEIIGAMAAAYDRR